MFHIYMLYFYFGSTTIECIMYNGILGIDVNILFNTGWTALMYAAHNAAPDSIDYLLRHGANPDARKGLWWSALHRIAEQQSLVTHEYEAFCCGTVSHYSQREFCTPADGLSTMSQNYISVGIK